MNDKTPEGGNDMTDDGPLMVDCGPHGKRVAAVVCQHMLQAKDQAVGFVENSSDPNDLQAWCHGCERLFLQEEEMTPAFREYNGMSLVCVVCYGELKARHDTRELGPGV